MKTITKDKIESITMVLLAIGFIFTLILVLSQPKPEYDITCMRGFHSTINADAQEGSVKISPSGVVSFKDRYSSESILITGNCKVSEKR